MTKKTRENLLESFLKEELSKVKYTPGEVVKIHRERFGFTQDVLSKITKIPSSNIALYETGKKNIGLKVAKKLAAAFGIHHDAILYPNVNDDEPEILDIKKRVKAILGNLKLASA